MKLILTTIFARHIHVHGVLTDHLPPLFCDVINIVVCLIPGPMWKKKTEQSTFYKSFQSRKKVMTDNQFNNC